MLDVAGHLLRANEHAFDLRVVDRGEVGTPVCVDVKSGAREQRDGRVLQTAFGNAKADFHRFTSAAVGWKSMFLVKQERVPSWQSRPSPSTSTRKSRQSLSQSVAAEITRRRLPEVSPFIHSFWRVRLKKVT